MMHEFFWLAVGMVGAAYFIGDGLKNFNNPNAKSLLSRFTEDDEWGPPKLIKENQVHDYIGISKEDAKALVKDYPSVPHIKVNGQVYFPVKKLKAWADGLSNEQ
ncbi:DNA-binding protein [Alkalicoccobacillus plakortidis]|uniref:DNA-binding protein n=1 Tax=Alkalicoccobacillus plakortidis TaxID=444060 RepID=A0ABT0XNR1_9BACI|nr:DNA-binding protein [Alkalicoccobacillus plakortidis]MCM2677539.1 DNA-binding protein [Alkalicoccobacillus plakortidis]